MLINRVGFVVYLLGFLRRCTHAVQLIYKYIFWLQDAYMLLVCAGNCTVCCCGVQGTVQYAVGVVCRELGKEVLQQRVGDPGNTTPGKCHRGTAAKGQKNSPHPYGC